MIRFGKVPTPSEAAVLERFSFKRDTLYMPVPRCDGCGYWSAIYSRAGITRGSCALMSWDTGALAHLSTSENQVPAVEVLTHADFGCVQWEERPR